MMKVGPLHVAWCAEKQIPADLTRKEAAEAMMVLALGKGTVQPQNSLCASLELICQRSL